MKRKCVEAVNGVLGREATGAEIREIERRLARTMRTRAGMANEAWLGLHEGDRLIAAARATGAEVRAEAELVARRKALAVLAMGRLQGHIADFPGSPLDALERLVAFRADARGSQQSLEYRAIAIERDALRQMLGTLEATNPKFFGMIEDEAGVRDLVRELHGEATGNRVAAEGARLFREVAETLRQRFNRSGGNIGHLEDWGMPHHHSQVLVSRAGREEWLASLAPAERAMAIALDRSPPPEVARAAYARDLAGWLDRSRYVDEDGRPLSDEAYQALLEGAQVTIATNGLNKLEPGQFRGAGMAGNRGSESRQLHFKDADSFIAYQAKYGEKSAFDVLIGHIQGIARDVAAVETFGPNPDHAFRVLSDQAVQQMTLADPAAAGAVQKQAMYTQTLFNMAMGNSIPVASPRVARLFDAVRATITYTRLGSAVLTAVTDEGTMLRIAAVNNLPQMQLWRNELKAFNLADADEKRLARHAGLGLNTLIESLNRFAVDNLTNGWSSKIATATLRASGLHAMTDARRRAFGVTYMSALGHVTKATDRLADLSPTDNRILLSKGITDIDFAVWKRAELEDWGDGNVDMLTPDAIYRIPDDRLADLGDPVALRQEAATKLLGTVLEETDMAVIEPGLRERAIIRRNIQRGTLTGELTLCAWQFKTFPLAMITKHWDRALSEPTGGARARALAALVTSTTVFGMIALQLAELRDGKDPRDMTDPRTWGAALLKGGALSIFGDFLFSRETLSGRSQLATLLGPFFGLVEETIDLTHGNLMESMAGEETNAGAELVRYARHNTPGVSAAMNLWYARAAVDHLVMHDLQELLSPGYLNSMRDRAEREFGASYWWEPGGSPFIDASGQDFRPERAPNLEKAIGAEQ